MNMPHTARAGLALGTAGVVILSPDALLLRLFGGDVFAMVGGRALALTAWGLLAMALVPILRHDMWRWQTAAYSALYAVGLASFAASIAHTHVANTVVILAVAPLIAAVGAKWFLGEAIASRTWAACAAAAVGLALVFAPQLAAGGWLGDAFALVTAASVAGCAIFIRRWPRVNLFPGLILAGVLVGGACAPFASWRLPLQDFAVLGANGLLVLAAFFCILAASRRLSPPEIGLLFLIETALSPLWVWLALGEKPPASTIAAGFLIAAVLMLHYAPALRKSRPLE